MKNVISTYRKNRQTVLRAYPWTLVIGRVLGGFFQILFPIFIYYFMFKSKIDSGFESVAGTSDYITYVVLGVSLNVLAIAVLMNVSRAMISEIREGTLEPFLISPASRGGYFVGAFLEQTDRALLEFFVVIIFGILFGAKVPLALLPEIIIALILAIFAFASMAVAMSSIMVYTRDTYVTQNTIFHFMYLTCGVIFPLEYLPKALQFAAQIFPLTPALELFRAVAIRQEPLFNQGILILHMASLSIVYILIGMYSFSKIEKKLIENVLS